MSPRVRGSRGIRRGSSDAAGLQRARRDAAGHAPRLDCLKHDRFSGQGKARGALSSALPGAARPVEVPGCGVSGRCEGAACVHGSLGSCDSAAPCATDARPRANDTRGWRRRLQPLPRGVPRFGFGRIGPPGASRATDWSRWRTSDCMCGARWPCGRRSGPRSSFAPPRATRGVAGRRGPVVAGRRGRYGRSMQGRGVTGRGNDG